MKNLTIAEKNELLKRMTLLDDVFMTKVFEESSNEVTALILKIILNRELTVTSVKVQDVITNLRGRSVRLDIHAVSADGKHFDIEIQRSNSGATPKRARYNSSLLDANLLAAGENFSALPETYVIFITESDVLDLNEPIYFIERMIVGKEKFFNDEAHIVYVNNSIRDDTPLGRLMHDFACADIDEMFYKILADKVTPFKFYERSGYKVMGVMEELLEQVRRETTEQVRRETAEQVRRETAEQVRRETAEQVRRETAEQVRRETAEKVRRETAEKTAVEKTIEFAKKLIIESELSLEKIASLCGLPLEKVQALAAAK